MTTDSTGLDRLMPRHSLPAALTIRWNTQPRRGRIGRAVDESTEGVIRDLSLTGALIEVDEPTKIKVGDTVEIRLGERKGTVLVRRIVPADDDHGEFYGVTFEDTDDLKAQFHILIGHLRGDDDRLRQAWNDAV